MSRGYVIDFMGPERSGKTDAALTVSENGKPTLLCALDFNYVAPYRRHKKRGGKIEVAECFYSLPYALPDSPKVKNFTKIINSVAEAVRPSLRRMEDRLFSFIREHGKKPGSANVVMDNGTLLYRTVRLAAFGYLHKVPMHLYAKSNNKMNHIINELRFCGLNVVWVHRVNREYNEATDRPTGNFIRDGHKSIGPDVQATLLTMFDSDYTNKKTGKTGRFGVEVVDSTFNPDTVGQQFWRARRTFSTITEALTEE